MRGWLGEALTALAFVAGWALVTAGVAHLTARVAWVFSAGILAISLGGWRLFGRMAWYGLYTLMRPPARKGR
jgi:hypothetical protein